MIFRFLDRLGQAVTDLGEAVSGIDPRIALHSIAQTMIFAFLGAWLFLVLIVPSRKSEPAILPACECPRVRMVEDAACADACGELEPVIIEYPDGIRDCLCRPPC